MQGALLAALLLGARRKALVAIEFCCVPRLSKSSLAFRQEMGALCSTTRQRADSAAPPVQHAEAAAASGHPTRVIARRLRKQDMEWDFMVEWSDARPSSWVTHAGLGTSAQDLVTAFNMSNPGALATAAPHIPSRSHSSRWPASSKRAQTRLISACNPWPTRACNI